MALVGNNTVGGGDFSLVIPVYDRNTHEKKGYMLYVFNEYFDVNNLQYFFNLDSIHGFYHPLPMFIFYNIK